MDFVSEFYLAVKHLENVLDSAREAGFISNYARCAIQDDLDYVVINWDARDQFND